MKTKLPNELGLYDMSGNVWEWCQDWKGAYSGNSQTNPLGPTINTSRVLRGGSWRNYTRDCRVSRRNFDFPDNMKVFNKAMGKSEPLDVIYNCRGFRLALSE